MALAGRRGSSPARTSNKAAILGMTRQLAMEGSMHGIRVNSISPGLIESGATRAQLDEGDGWARQMLDRTLMGRLGQPEEVANVALSSPATIARTSSASMSSSTAA
jgi:NAD(P)-dependent dehydrogenase (short-subunit alcohol dehydrogenase family)